MCISLQEEKLRLPKKFEPSQCLMTLRSNVRQLNMQFCALELAGNLCSAVFFISSSLFFAYWLKEYVSGFFIPGRTPTATNWPDGSAASVAFPLSLRPSGPNSGSMSTKLSPLSASWMANWQKLASARACKRRRGKWWIYLAGGNYLLVYVILETIF